MSWWVWSLARLSPTNPAAVRNWHKNHIPITDKTKTVPNTCYANCFYIIYTHSKPDWNIASLTLRQCLTKFRFFPTTLNCKRYWLKNSRETEKVSFSVHLTLPVQNKFYTEGSLCKHLRKFSYLELWLHMRNAPRFVIYPGVWQPIKTWKRRTLIVYGSVYFKNRRNMNWQLEASLSPSLSPSLPLSLPTTSERSGNDSGWCGETISQRTAEGFGKGR